MSQKAVMDLLDKMSVNLRFAVRLAYGHESLVNYDLDPSERRALLRGDIKWLEAHTGSLAGQMGAWTRYSS